MSIEVFGLIILACAGLAFLKGADWAFGVLCLATSFQSAAAVSVPALGGANIQPGHFILPVFLAAVFLRGQGFAYSLNAMALGSRPGFWYVAAGVWAVMTALIMPRLFAGAVEVFPVDNDNSSVAYQRRALFPTSNNITQSVYFIGHIMAYCAVVGFARRADTMIRGAVAVLVLAAVTVFFAYLDVLLYYAGLGHLLDFLRTSSYTLLTNATLGGLKRVVGTFTEASAYAAFAIGLFAFTLRLWRYGVWPRETGLLALALFVSLILSTSTTAYASLAIFLVAIYARDLAGMERAAGRQNVRAVFLSFVPFGAFAIAVVIALRPELLDPVAAIFDDTITNKLASDSGKERGSWNMSGLQNVVETYGLGVGLGSVRVSSLLVAFPASIGLIGSVLFAMFLARLFFPKFATWPEARRDPIYAISAAARSACFAMFIAATLSAGVANMPLIFFLYAGLATPAYFWNRRAVRQFDLDQAHEDGQFELGRRGA